MLYWIEIENFYSIKEKQVLDLRIPDSVPDDEARFAPIFPGSKERVAKVVGIFGPNGSGKSNILKTLPFLIWFLSHSFHHEGDVPCEAFNDRESGHKPILLAAEWGGRTGRTDAEGKQEVGAFRYELLLHTEKWRVDGVLNETMRFRRNGRGKWTRVFERSKEGHLAGSELYSLSGFTSVIGKIRPNASCIATLAQFEHEPSKKFLAVLKQISSNILLQRIDPPDQHAISFLAQNQDVAASLNDLLKRVDFGIERMEFRPVNGNPVPMFHHRNLHVPMPWPLESDGTRSFIRIFPWIYQALQNGSLAVIDEIDRSLHTELVAEIIGWFHDPDRNPHGAQLLFSCHQSALLEDMVKEEVVLTEKDSQGRTRFYSLMEVKGVRRDDSLYRKYRAGAYGALPIIG